MRLPQVVASTHDNAAALNGRPVASLPGTCEGRRRLDVVGNEDVPAEPRRDTREHVLEDLTPKVPLARAQVAVLWRDPPQCLLRGRTAVFQTLLIEQTRA